MGKPAAIPPPPESDYGPKMRALTTNGQRRFVLALLAQTHRDYSAAYLEAGYSSTGKGTNYCAHRMAHDERIQDALQEEAGRRLKALLPLALHTVETIMENPQAKEADRVKVAFGVLDRSGLSAVVEHKVMVGLAGDTEMLARIKMLAERNGIPLEQLLGASMVKTIEHVPVEDEFADEEY
jgi:hypothetical protein